MSRLNFTLEKEASGSKARATRFRTLHNEVLTPTFMPVATKATVRYMTKDVIDACGAQVLLANTYHLLLRPGPEVFEQFGGIHKFMKWPRSVLTDSGGFQIFSLPNKRQITEEGARFRSYVDGAQILLSPERSIQMQRSIGSDIMMVLDECVPSTCDHKEALRATELTHRWALRSLAARGDSPQSVFAIIQGACYEDLRRQSADFLTQHPFDGFAIGGLAVGETKAEREDFTELTAGMMPRHLPRYLMGVGTPIDLLEAVHRGVDMFDCILPTAMAEQGIVYTWQGRLQIKRSVYKFAEEPIDKNCPCPTCKEYSRAYLYHLNKCAEPSASTLLSTHNLYFYQDLMRTMREHILADTFAPFYRQMRDILAREDIENPIQAPKTKKRKVRKTEWGAFDIVTSDRGHASIRHRDSGEVMHSVEAPDVEARRLYVEQSQIIERLLTAAQPGEAEEIVLWDVGLGAAHNVMATINALEAAVTANPGTQRRRLKIVSFENDLDSLRLAMSRADIFEHVRHQAPEEILAHEQWTSKKADIEWTLFTGDFFEHYPRAPQPDIVFFDPFSSKCNTPFWTFEAFTALRTHFGSRPVELYTYSASTRVRASLLAAGFFVAAGVGTGPKAETTIALSPVPLPNFSLLDERWMQRWNRSDARHETLNEAIAQHRQFCDL